jgi:hypothetical protein
LRRPGSDRRAHGSVDSRRAQSDHIRHPARRLKPETLSSRSQLLLYFGETLFPFLVKKKARGRIVKIRDVRQTEVRQRAAKGHEVSSAAWAITLHR